MKRYQMSSETVKAADTASCLKIENLQEIKTAQRGQMGMRAEEKQQSIKNGEKQPGFQLHWKSRRKSEEDGTTGRGGN